MKSTIKEVPFFFFPDMVRAIMHGTKDQIRRAIKGVDMNYRLLSCGIDWADEDRIVADFAQTLKPVTIEKWAKARPGNIIWVRETWSQDVCHLWLPVVEVRVERLQDISSEDAIAQGIFSHPNPSTGNTEYYHYLKHTWGPSPIHSYQTLWEKNNGPGSWEANPWVWVYRWAKLPEYTREAAIAHCSLLTAH